MLTIQLKRGKSESLKRFHPWVFSGAIAHKPAALQEGDTVRVVDAAGELLGTGHYQSGSIAVRILSFREQALDGAFWRSRLAEACRLRRALGLLEQANNDICRLVHGEGDRLPGLIIDLYGTTAVMQAHSTGMHRARHEIAAALRDTLGDRLQAIYYKSATTLPDAVSAAEREGYLLGQRTDDVFQENGMKFHVDWEGGQKTGFFVDQRDNRALLSRYAQGRRVLNLFCYTGGFSVYALRGGARHVTSVDSSARAIEAARANVELNFPEGAPHEAVTADAFQYLQAAEAPLDLIVLDPPAFAKHLSAVRNALKGYTRLNAAAIRKVQPGGFVFTFSCSQAVSAAQFRLAVFTAAATARRHVRILHQLHQPADHPVSIYHPEGEYLKGLVLQVE